MSTQLKNIYLCRHGETDWSKNGRHTSYTDLPLTSVGEEEARMLGSALKGIEISYVFTSPLKRAKKTASLAGFDGAAVEESALFEWRYGDYEGLTTVEIQKTAPGWNIFDQGPLAGESLDQVQERCQKFIAYLLTLPGNICLFSSGHISRALGAVWLGLPVSYGKYFMLSTASISQLSFEHGNQTFRLWNQTSHLHTN